MAEDQAVEVVITAPDDLFVRMLVGELVYDRLAAAGHLTRFETIYQWQGEMHNKHETRAVLYTRAGLVGQIVERTKRHHPYEVPHVTATPIVAGNPDYLAWISTETANKKY
jgi:periplasmic divalent cation tolerance protein